MLPSSIFTKKTLLIIGGLLVLTIVGVNLYLLLDINNTKTAKGLKLPSTAKTKVPTANKNVLLLTQPVMSFSGVVENVSGNVLTVSHNFSFQPYQNTASTTVISPAENLTGQPTPPAPITKKLTYQISVGPNTQISRPPLMVNYLFATPTPAPQVKLTVNNIKKNQTISVYCNVDLRILQGDEFEALSVQLPQMNNFLSGKIVAMDNNYLTVKSFVSTYAPNTAPKGKKYKIAVNDKTEISRYEPIAVNDPKTLPQPLKPEKLSLSDLKENMRVNIYTAEDITTSLTLTALRVEPLLSTTENPPPILSPAPK